MNESVISREALWDEFLKRWPLESLQSMSLQQYTQAGNDDCFVYWLEAKTESLGSIWGGSAFKFGIFSRKAKTERVSEGSRSYGDEYAWYSKYGDSPQAAFEQVRARIVEVATAARAGEFEKIRRIHVGRAFKWKIAFLYQDRQHPQLIPVYSADLLAAYLGERPSKSLLDLQRAALAKRGDANIFSFGEEVWTRGEAILKQSSLTPDEAIAFLDEHPERFQPIKQATKYIAGYATSNGLQLAVNRSSGVAKLWLQPGGWQDDVAALLKDAEIYGPDRVRNSNLGANAPMLAEGNPALLVTVPDRAALIELCGTYDDTDASEIPVAETSAASPTADVPLNQILYGPPGTGKTYETIDAALEILDPEFLKGNKRDRSALKRRFDTLAADGRVRFVTFHQSFSYEDFVEGLRAELDEVSKQPNYVIEDGVFKQLCLDAAQRQSISSALGVGSSPSIWKISIDGTGHSPTRNYCLANNEARIGWGRTGDLRQANLDSPEFRLGVNDKHTLQSFAYEIEVGDVLLCIKSNTSIAAVGVVQGEYRYDKSVPAGVLEDYLHVLPVNWVLRDLDFSILPLNGQKRLTLKTVYELTRFTWPELESALLAAGYAIQQTADNALQEDPRPFVLIIDEINRGNVSRIFGELITLIEPSKREGAAEALTVQLPCSKKRFSVPANVHLIGTMNTADRSLAGLDIALRRRFVFREMPPRPDFLDAVEVEGIGIGALMRVMNQRIEVLLDRDHCLGHAYFLPLKDDATLTRLASIFRHQILPLLQEYFFEDWQRIQWALNDHRKVEADRFLARPNLDPHQLFGNSVDIAGHGARWEINEAAFNRIDAYRGIIDAGAQAEQ